MSMDSHTIHGDGITVAVKADGAEMVSVKNADGAELLWQALPVWPRHSPILFPIVGRLKGDELHHRGKTYPMTLHGFARDHRFDWVERGEHSCTLALTDSAATRVHYPFAFRLALTYAVKDDHLDVTFEITNTGDETLPASAGGHPAFKWPLSAELAKQAHSIIFSNEEREPIRRLNQGLMRKSPVPTPIQGKTLPLSERLFDDDAVILDRPASTGLRYAADRGPWVEVSWQGFRELGLWSKLGGADFLCIEPWRGFASPEDFDGEFSDKPGLMHLAPGEKQTLTYRVRVG
jgi:galactose mutarotase-like enzyme